LRLRDGLSYRYVVDHSVHWAKADQNGVVYGEVDFIVANDAGRLLAIEQKDAQIVATSSDPFVRYPPAGVSRDLGRAAEKSITTQVNRALNALRPQFSRRYPGRAPEIDHLLCLPLARLEGELPSSIGPTRVVDADQDDQLESVIEQLLAGLPAGWSDDRLDDLPHIESFCLTRWAPRPISACLVDPREK
jgi:hypothetical protein